MGGSSPYDLFTGMQSATSQSQFGVNGLQGHLMGSGAVTSDVTRELFLNYQSDFYTPTGASNRRMTAGFGDAQMGSLFQELGQRGAFAGMQVGSYDAIGFEELENRKHAARESDNTAELKRLEDWTPDTEVFKLDDEAKRKISDYVSSAAQALGSLREVFGARPMQELMQQAELITGENFVAAGPDYIKGRIDETRGLARAYGIDEAEALGRNVQTTRTIDAMMSHQTGMPQGSFQQVAASLSPVADENAMIAYQAQLRNAAAARERGEYMPVKSLEEITALSGTGLAHNALNESQVSEAAALLSMHGADEETRSEVMTAMRAVGEAPTLNERKKARAALAKLTADTFGVTSGDLERGLLGKDGMLAAADPDMRRFTGTIYGDIDQASMLGNFERIAEVSNTAKRSGLFTSSEDAGAYMQTYMQRFNEEDRQDMREALNGRNSRAEVTDIVMANAQHLPPGVSAEEFIEFTVRGGSKLAYEMGNTENTVARTPSMGNMVNWADVAADSRLQLSQSIRDSYHGGRNLGGGMGLAEGVWQGILGGGDITDEDVLNFMERDGKLKRDVLAVKLNDDGTISMDTGQAKEFAAIAGEDAEYLFQKLGVKNGDYGALAKKLSTHEGHAAMRQFMNASGMVVDNTRPDKNKDRTMRIGGSEGAREASKEIAALADSEMYNSLLGKDMTPDELASISERALNGDQLAADKQDGFLQTITDNLKAKPGEYLKELNADSSTGNALRAYMVGHKGVLDSLKSAEEDKRTKGKDEEADKLKELRKELGGSDGAPKQELSLTGTVKLIGGDEAELNLTATGGGETLGA